jgi:hypothetical protein
MSLSIAQVVETDLGFKKSPNIQFPSKGDFLLGTIKLRGISRSGPAHEFYASPAWNINYVPCKGEHVIVVQGLAKSGVGSSLDTHYYYLGPINIQGNVHLNPLPDVYTVTNTSGYTVSAAPKINAPKPYSAGRNFVEQADIKNLQPFEGDMILHGRHGQALRFSSGIAGDTSHYQESPFWKGKQGSPITILSNGYTPKAGPNQYVIEDPEKTKSSVILSSDQQFSTIPMSQRNVGLGIQPINIFNKPQVIVSSDRVVLNAKEDTVIISGKKTVSIATPAWAVDMDKFFTQVNSIQTQLTSLTSQVTALTSLIATSATADVTVATALGMPGAAANIAGTATILPQLSTITSELSKITTILATLKQ